MENNESNPQPHQTGGLKLMTVFIGVLALHVVVIGGFTVYHLMNGGSSDTELVTDKNHKGVKVTPDGATLSEGQLTDAAATEKNPANATPGADTTGNPVTIPAPGPEQNLAAAPQPAPAPVPALVPSSPPAAHASAGPIRSGPVITPPVSSAPRAPAVTPEPVAPVALDSEVPPSGGVSYTVKAHETLAKIAHRNHVKLAALRSANGLTSDKVHKGQKLTIPGRTELAAAAPDESERQAQAAPASSGPDRTLLGDSPRLAKSSVSSTSHERATVAPSGGSRHSYVVARGDTLIRIAHKFHTSTNALMALNNISDARKLRPGQKLRIPSSEARSARSTPASEAPERIEPRATPSAQLANFIN